MMFFEICDQVFRWSTFIFFAGCFTSSFVNTANARAKNSNSPAWCFIWGIGADIAWFLLFKTFIADNVLGVNESVMPYIYVTGYSLGRPLAQITLMKLAKGDNSVGGTQGLEERINKLEESSNESNRFKPRRIIPRNRIVDMVHGRYRRRSSSNLIR